VLDETASVWDDWWPGDEERDIEENRKEFPQGFRWMCCNATGDIAGCKKRVHRPDRMKRVRTER
jgi:hypothetical protein